MQQYGKEQFLHPEPALHVHTHDPKFRRSTPPVASSAMVERKSGLKVFVVTSSALLRAHVLRLSRTIAGAEVIGEAHGAESALKKLAQVQPDLVLLNVSRITRGEVDLLDYVKRHRPDCKTAVLSKAADMNSNRHFLKDRSHVPDAFIDQNDQASVLACMEMILAEKGKLAPMCFNGSSANRLIFPRNNTGHPTPVQQDRTTVDDSMAGRSPERRRQPAGRRHSEIAMKETADRFQSFLEQIPGMPYIIELGAQCRNLYVSPKVEELLGFTAEQWCMDPELRTRQIHPEDRDRALKAIDNAIASKSRFSIEYRVFKQDASLRWLHDEACVVAGSKGNSLFLQGSVIDVTERKHAQAELERSHHELQELIVSLDALRSEEQKRLAHEMHDDFGQLLAAMKMDVAALEQQLPVSDARIVRHLGSINELIDTMVASVRRIISDLPPKVLEDMGLCSALRSMAGSFEQRYGISCRLHLPETEPLLQPKLATALYRIVQETLTNVAKHAGASRVDVHLGCSGAHVEVQVVDDGSGIAPEMLHKTDSFGLIGMRERVSALGGRMQLDSEEGKGTAIRIRIPF